MRRERASGDPREGGERVLFSVINSRESSLLGGLTEIAAPY